MDKVFYEKRDTYIYLKVSGVRSSTAQLLEGTQLVYDLAKKNNCNYVLCDFTEIEFRLNMAEAFNLVRIYETRFEDFKSLSLAGVVNSEFEDIAGFWEKISIKRGFNNKSFTSVEKAAKWLNKQAT